MERGPAHKTHSTEETMGPNSRVVVHVDPLGMIQVGKNHLRLLSVQTKIRVPIFGCPNNTDYSILAFSTVGNHDMSHICVLTRITLPNVFSYIL